MAQEACRKPRHSGGHPVYCPDHDVSDHLPIGRLCVHTQGKLELSIESRDITVLGAMDLLEMRGMFTVLKLRRKDAFLDWALVLSRTYFRRCLSVAQ